MHRNPVIVHISDLHFGRNVRPHLFWRSSINHDAKRALKRAILAIQPRPDFIVVTGDVANSGARTEMRQARDYLLSILDSLWAEGHVARCVLVPGNHDVWHTTWADPRGYFPRGDRLREWNSVFDCWSFLSPNVPEMNAAHLTPYSLEGYYRGRLREPDASDDYIRMLANRSLRTCEFFPIFGLGLLKLDSNVRPNRWRPASIARGHIGQQQRTIVDEILHDYDLSTRDDATPFGDARLIALVHHHVTRLPNVTQEDWMFMDDAGEVVRWLAKIGVRFVLHGHYHRADVVGIKYWNVEAGHSPADTIVLSAGSATALEADDGHNSCHYIHLGQFRTRIWRPHLDNGEFQDLSTAALFEFEHQQSLRLIDDSAIHPPTFIEALHSSVRAEEQYADYSHSYSLVDSTGVIDNDRSYHGFVELAGRNETRLPTTEIPFTVSAVGAQNFDDCRWKVYDLEHKRQLSPPEAVTGRPIHAFPCRIFFANPLAPQASFRIRVEFRLPMVMLDTWDYDLINLVRFTRGVANFRMALLARRQMVGASVWELRNDRVVRSAL